jgi:hypothetical protein
MGAAEECQGWSVAEWSRHRWRGVAVGEVDSSYASHAMGDLANGGVWRSRQGRAGQRVVGPTSGAAQTVAMRLSRRSLSGEDSSTLSEPAHSVNGEGSTVSDRQGQVWRVAELT